MTTRKWSCVGPCQMLLALAVSVVWGKDPFVFAFAFGRKQGASAQLHDVSTPDLQGCACDTWSEGGARDGVRYCHLEYGNGRAAGCGKGCVLERVRGEDQCFDAEAMVAKAVAHAIAAQAAQSAWCDAWFGAQGAAPCCAVFLEHASMEASATSQEVVFQLSRVPRAQQELWATLGCARFTPALTLALTRKHECPKLEVAQHLPKPSGECEFLADTATERWGEMGRAAQSQGACCAACRRAGAARCAVAVFSHGMCWLVAGGGSGAAPNLAGGGGGAAVALLPRTGFTVCKPKPKLNNPTAVDEKQGKCVLGATWLNLDGRSGNEIFHFVSTAGAAAHLGCSLCVTAGKRAALEAFGFRIRAPDCCTLAAPDWSDFETVDRRGDPFLRAGWPELEQRSGRGGAALRLLGYLQSSGYYEGHKGDVLQHIGWSPRLLGRCTWLARAQLRAGRKLLTMHVRGTDYMKQLRLAPDVAEILRAVARIHAATPVCVTIVSDSPGWCIDNLLPKLRAITGGCARVVQEAHGGPGLDMCIAGRGDYVFIGAGTFSFFAAFFRADQAVPVYFEPRLWRWDIWGRRQWDPTGLRAEHSFYPPHWRPFGAAADLRAYAAPVAYAPAAGGVTASSSEGVDKDAFTNATGVQCNGLVADSHAGSAASCEQNCRDDNACGMWQWWSASTTSAGGGCWRGQCVDDLRTNAGWVGGKRATKLVAKMGLDGDVTTRWSSGRPYRGQVEWLAVDLGSATTTVRAALLVWEAAYASSFAVQVSNSSLSAASADWVSVYSTTVGAGGVQQIALEGTGRFWRVLCIERAAGNIWGFSLYEFQLFSSALPFALPALLARA